MNRERQTAEIAANYDQFQRSLTQYLASHRDQFALMRDGKVVAFFDSPSAADTDGAARYPDRIYSIQKVTDEPVEFGIYANAIH